MSISKIWLWSDPHFGHKNILNFTSYEGGPRIRPEFSDLDDMNETIIRNYNRCVRPEDIVYCLGDIGWHIPTLDKILPRLMGKKRLILGNHDTLEMSYYRKYFQKIMTVRYFSNKDIPLKNNFIASHYPLHLSTFEYKPNCFNIHGHTHEKNVVYIDRPNVSDPRYINVCVEKTNYCPVLLTDIDKSIS